jgi:rSAM/selenodomain-associated transferase 2
MGNAMPAPISVIIPTLNAAHQLGATCDALLPGVTDGLVAELVISDGGSSDQTREAARELGAVWVEGPKGRGAQIKRGIAAASSDWVLILHADTHLSDSWPIAARRHLHSAPEDAGWFQLRFRAKGLAPRVIAQGANLRSQLFGLPYGDQGFLVARSVLDNLGGYPNLPLMEDVALAHAFKGRLRRLDACALTSAQRYQRDGWARRSLANLGTLARYLAGADPADLIKRYEA